MAQLTELLRMLQPLDGRDEQTLYNSARKLRDEGLLPKGKRGSGAPELDYEHAANVVLGVIGSTRSVDAADRCRLLGSLKNYEEDWSADESSRTLFFGNRVTELLEQLPQALLSVGHELSRVEKTNSKKKVQERLRDCIVNRGPIAMNLLLRTRSSRLEVMTKTGKVLEHENYVSDPSDSLLKEAYDRRGKDREVTIQVGLMTLVATRYAVVDETGREEMNELLGMPVTELLYGKGVL